MKLKLTFVLCFLSSLGVAQINPANLYYFNVEIVDEAQREFLAGVEKKLLDYVEEEQPKEVGEPDLNMWVGTADLPNMLARVHAGKKLNTYQVSIEPGKKDTIFLHTFSQCIQVEKYTPNENFPLQWLWPRPLLTFPIRRYSEFLDPEELEDLFNIIGEQVRTKLAFEIFPGSQIHTGIPIKVSDPTLPIIALHYVCEELYGRGNHTWFYDHELKQQAIDSYYRNFIIQDTMYGIPGPNNLTYPEIIQDMIFIEVGIGITNDAARCYLEIAPISIGFRFTAWYNTGSIVTGMIWLDYKDFLESQALRAESIQGIDLLRKSRVLEKLVKNPAAY